MEKKLKVCNLYCGIGGNRKLWPEECEVTAVEFKQEIADIYKDFFPNDKVIVADAHEYLLQHYDEFDFIWSSPPCPTHTRFNNLKKEQIDKGFKPKFPDMKLYEEIIFLNQYFKGVWVVENVKSYYKPLIRPFESGNHYFWSNKNITNMKSITRCIRTNTANTNKSIEEKEKDRGFVLSGNLTKSFKIKILNNCVFPELGLHIFNAVFKEQQRSLIDGC